jgi:hypothetical protein
MKQVSSTKFMVNLKQRTADSLPMQDDTNVGIGWPIRLHLSRAASLLRRAVTLCHCGRRAQFTPRRA